MDIVSNFYTAGIIYLLTLASGVWLSYTGRPLNSMIFTIHKLIALGAVILTWRQVYPLLKSGKAESLVIVSLVIVGLCIVALVATGALMSLDKPAYDIFQRIHQVALVLMTIGMVWMVYLFAGSPLWLTQV